MPGQTRKQRALPESLTRDTTTGEHAWRATWTPDPDAEEQYLADLLEGGDYRFGEGYLDRSRDKLIQFGYGICSDYYRGVAGADEYQHVINELMDDVVFQPSLPNNDYSRLAREGAASGAALELTMAANGHLCMNIDPWGEDY